MDSCCQGISHLYFPQKARQAVSLPERIGSINSCCIPIAWFACFSSHIDFFSPPFPLLNFCLTWVHCCWHCSVSACCISSQTSLGGTAVGTGDKCGGIFCSWFIYLSARIETDARRCGIVIRVNKKNLTEVKESQPLCQLMSTPCQ